ncbi:MAG TPA: methyltransferase domain-containing protein [Streptosporangiaceae bacterium]|nr:methyltransferase domain-containing protein [Streptosporangiaceae bacterium]
MHPSAYAFASTALTADQVAGARVVEAGALNVNGSVRGPVEALGPASYTGTDAQPGPGVDLVCPAEKLPGVLGEDSADILLTTEMLEHAEDWRAAVAGMVRVLAPGGLLVLTTRGPGFPYHGYPGDFWRFTVNQMDGIAEAAGLEVIRCEPDPDPASPGVFLLAAKPEAGWDGAGMAEGLEVIEPGPPR